MTPMIVRRAAEMQAADLQPAGRRPGADLGDPQLKLAPFAPAAGGRIGLWECAPGGWPVTDRPDTECAFILSGRAILTDAATGSETGIGPGDLVVLPPGWTGRWTILETVRKIYVIY